MLGNQPSGVISQDQYTEYLADWLALLNSGDTDALSQVFQASETARINFLIFSIDQAISLVAAKDARYIKARYLLLPDASGQARFTVTLFATDASGKRLSEYYIPPTPPATTSTAQVIQPAPEPSTKIPREAAIQWLTDWVVANPLTDEPFDTPHGPLQGCNFELSTFREPLAVAQPYAGKGLYLNFGLNKPELVQDFVLVVYINALGTRTQGNLAGLPTNDSFYDMGTSMPPNH